MPAALLVSKSPPLCGELTVHGAKNSVLPILAATLLCRTPCVLHNCPDILDVTHTLQILRHLGCSCERSGSTLSIDPRGFAENAVPPALAGSMRASSLFLGALLARTGAAALTLPGGCPIGARPIDYHLQAFRALGASAEEESGTVRCRADRLHGARLCLPLFLRRKGTIKKPINEMFFRPVRFSGGRQGFRRIGFGPHPSGAAETVGMRRKQLQYCVGLSVFPLRGAMDFFEGAGHRIRVVAVALQKTETEIVGRVLLSL